MRRIYAVTMTNGDVYGISASVIADNYAKYYQRHGEDYQENYNTMINWFDEDDYEFADWAKNNMDWDDVKEHAVLLEHRQEPVDFQEGWINGGYEYKQMDVMGDENAE